MTRNEILSKAKPILFNTEMVRAILNGRKTVTRRIVKNNPEECTSKVVNGVCKICDDKGGFYLPNDYVKARSPYNVGDILYVRETWKMFYGMLYGFENGTYIPLDDFEGYQYKVDEQCICTKGFNPLCDCFDDQKNDVHFDDKWRPSIHMPKEAARIFLRVTKVRVERLQDITEKTAEAEGLQYTDDVCQDESWRPTFYDPDSGGHPSLVSGFSVLWDNTIKKSDIDKYGWNANP